MLLKKNYKKRNDDNLEIIHIINILDDSVKIKTSDFMPTHIDSSVLVILLRKTGAIMIHPEQLEELHFIESRYEVV